MQAEIDQFILYLATERGLSANYQISTRISLEAFAKWLSGSRETTDTDPRKVTHGQIGDYLAHCKKKGLAAASIKLIVVAIKIFFRFLHVRKIRERDVAEVLPMPRIERYLPETL